MKIEKATLQELEYHFPFVTLDIAQLAKENNIHIACFAKYASYNPTDKLELFPHSQDFFKGPSFNTCTNEEYEGVNKIAAPTYDQLLNWFDKNKIYLQPHLLEQFNLKAGWGYELLWVDETDVEEDLTLSDEDKPFNSREEALYFGILHAFKALKTSRHL